MSAFWRVDGPTDRSTVGWIFDALVALVAGLAAVPYLMRHEESHPSASAFVAIAVVVTPLVLRRRYPLQVFGWVVLAAGLAGLWDHRIVVGLAVLIALYTVAGLLPWKVLLACVGLVLVTVVAAAITISGMDWWYDTIPLSGLLAAAAGLGLYAATRRAYLQELHDRADRLERERDQQGALAAAAERARIAREMHDIVAHHLTVMVALSDGAIAATARSPETGIETMREVSATGRRALSDTRRLLGVLREESPGASRDARQPTPDLSELGDLIDRVRAAGLPTTLEVHGAATRTTTAVQITAYRLVQEALTNTLKHGGPDAHAAVSLQLHRRELRIRVDDDGRGITAPAPATAGGGLAGMRERVLAYGGDIQAGPRAPSGWQVRATLVLEEGERE